MSGIAFTYDIGTPTGQTRFYAGDTNGAFLNSTGGDRTRTDAEIAFLLKQNSGDVRAAAAELLESKATEYATAATSMTQGNLKQDLTARSGKCLDAAKALRANVSGGPIVAAPTPVFVMPAPNGTVGTMEDW